MSDQKILLVNEVKDNVRMKYSWSIGLLAIPAAYIFSNINNLELLPFYLGVFLGTNFIPNFITLFLIKCPFCSKRYFKPKFCSNKELVNLFNSDSSCDHCKNKAAIFAGELSNDLLE